MLDVFIIVHSKLLLLFFANYLVNSKIAGNRKKKRILTQVEFVILLNDCCDVMIELKNGTERKNYRISSYSCRGNYSFLEFGVRQVFKGRETIVFLILSAYHTN